MVWVYDERNWWLSKKGNKRTTQRLGIKGDGGDPRGLEGEDQDLLK